MAGAAVLAVSATACGAPSGLEDATPAASIRQLGESVVPSEMLGMKVEREDMAETIKGVERSYVDSVGLYSVRRKDDVLQATLQVSRFNDNARYETSRFRRSLLLQIGGSRPSPLTVGDDKVWATTGTKQQLFVWFRGRHLMVLAVRSDFAQPRTLLREALEIEP